MASHEQNLRALEQLMTEFFHPSTTNEKKHQIEEMLNNFSQQKDSWQYCLYFIQNTTNEYVMMYCLTVLEILINKQWLGLMSDQKGTIREAVTKYLVSNHTKIPTFIRNKMAKLNVDIARHDWPHFYHSFLTDALQLTQQMETAGLGLIILQTTSEEMASPREDISVSRKGELQQLLLSNMPTILSTLTNLLDSVLDKHHLLLSATPPPSPTSSSTISLEQHRGILARNIFSSPMNKPSSKALSPLDQESYLLCSQVLACLGHLFSWIPLSTMITSSLLTTIFHFAAFGCETPRSVTLATVGNGQTLGMLAMGCINELLAKNCVPADFEEFILQLFQQTFYLMKKLTQDTGGHMEQLDQNFVDKFTEFVRLFVNNHLRRFEASSHFPVLDFLSLLFEYTFKQPSVDGFYSCLDIWQIFVDYIKGATSSHRADTSLSKYSDGLMALVRQLLCKMQFRHNSEQLETLDDESLDDDGITEWQRFVNHCNDTLAAIAELMPSEITQLLDSLFEEKVSVYLQLDKCVSGNGDARQLSVGEANVPQLHTTIRDLCTIVQTYARLVDHFTGATFPARFESTDRFLNRLIQVELYNESMKFYDIRSSPVVKLKQDFVEIYAQTLAALKAFTPWISQYYLESFHKPEVKNKCMQLIIAMITSAVTTVDSKAPGKVLEWSVQLIASVMGVVRPLYLYDITCVRELYTKISQGLSHTLPPKTKQVLLCALSGYLIVRWPTLSEVEQQWESRLTSHSAFVNSLYPQFLQLKDVSQLAINKPMYQQAKEVIRNTLTGLSQLIDAINVETKKTKEIMYNSVKEYIQISLHLFSVYIADSDVLEVIIDFFLVLVRCLRVQMGIPFTEQTIQTFLTMFDRQRISEILVNESKTGFKVIESFLKILELVVQEPGLAFKALLPRIIAISTEHVYPLVAEKPSPDIKMPLYELLHQLLNNNWKYFYPSSVISTFGATNPSEPLDHQQQLVSILQAFGQSFLQPDIAIFRHNLQALENLNSKWKLYHKSLFLDSMMAQFLNVLLQALIVKSHDLLQEDIVITLYNMAAVDFSMFYTTFLPNFLKHVNTVDSHQKEVLLENFSKDRDLPTFAANVNRLVNDLRYYTVVNASLPPGTVDLTTDNANVDPISEY